MRKKMKKLLSLLMVFSITVSMLGMTVSAATTGTETSPYTYTFYNAKSGKMTDWEYSPYMLSKVGGTTFRDTAGLLYLYGDNSADVAAYCADLGQSFANQNKFKRINLEDAPYFNENGNNESAEKLRSVFSVDKVSNKTYRNYYWYDWTDAELEHAQGASGVTSLTRAQALSATQIAVWYCCNGGEIKDNITVADITKIVEYYDMWWLSDYFKDFVFQYEGKNGGQIPLTGYEDCDGDGTTAKNNIYDYAKYLLSKPKQPADEKYILFSSRTNGTDANESFVETETSVVFASQANNSGMVPIYSVAAKFTLVTNIEQNGLTFTATLGNKLGTVEKISGTTYMATFDNLSYDDVNGGEITLKVSGQQDANGVYFYEAQPLDANKVESARKTSQNMVGPYTGKTTVSAEAKVKVQIGSTSVTLTKTDDTQNANPVSGATFNLYAKGVENPIRTGLITDENGQIVVSGLPAGYTYIFKEYTAPVGYIKNSEDCVVDSTGNAYSTNAVNMCELSLTKKVEGVSTEEHFDFTITLDLSTAELGSAAKVLEVLGLDSEATKISFTAEAPTDCTDGDHSSTVVFNKNSEDNKFVAAVKLKHNETLKVKGIPAGVTYTITEDSGSYVSSGTVEHQLGGNNDKVTVTNTRKEGKIDVAVKKYWDDVDDQLGVRPASIQVQLTADGKPYGAAVTLNADNDWYYEWSDLYEYKGKTKIEYDVAEVTVPAPYESKKAEPDYEDGCYLFAITNSVEKTGVTIDGTKSLAGDETNAKPEFTFVLKDSQGSVIDTQHVTGAGSFTFKTLEYAKPGEYTYTVTEEAGNADGWTYDTSVFDVVVTVTKEADGTLKAEVATSAANGIEFINTYAASCSIELEASKSLTGTQLKAGQFNFIVSENSAKVAEGTNDADGKIKFSKIEYTTADVGEHTYTISEVQEDAPGYTYDTHEATVTVNVVNNHDGTMTATPTYTGGSAKFENTYEASGQVVLSATKALSGRTLEAEQFSFELKDSDGTVLQNKTNAADGSITFDAIEYDQDDAGKTFTYTISEAIPNPKAAGYTYDDSVHKVTVEVKDNGDGTLTANATYEGGIAKFENAYEASGSIVLQATKTLDNQGLKKDQFNFVVTENGTQVAEGTNDAEGKIVFSEIEYDQGDVGTHTYKISEVVPEKNPKNGISYDMHEETVTVVVTDNGDGTLSAAETYASQGGAKFENTYSASGSIVLQASKSLTGATLEKNQFQFVVMEGNKEVAKGTNDEQGSIVFSKITYNLSDVGSHIYKIREVVPEKNPKNGVTYDTHEETVTVLVADNGNGTLSVTPTYAGGSAKFENTYTASGDVELNATKTLNGSTLRNGQFSFELKDANGNVLQTKSNDENGRVTFDLISYTLADAGQTYTYTISEVQDNAAGYTYDSHVETVTVTVSHQGNGKISAVKTYDSDGAVFTNSYSASGSATLQATKTLIGSTLRDGQFSFQLKDANGNVLQTKTNAADGAIVFDAIAYDQDDAGKTFTYTISEVAGNVAGFVYDGHSETVAVEVTDQGNGHLSTVVTYDTDGAVFENRYNQTSISISKTVTKVWNDNNNEAGKRPASITIQLLQDGDVYDTAVLSEGNWSKTWGNLPSGHTWTTKEVNVPDGYTQKVDGLVITNTYTEQKSETASVSVGKIWDDNNNIEGKRPSSITVTLLKDGVAYETATLSDANGWSVNWNDLDEEAVWTVEESSVPDGYTSVVTGGNGSFTITNTYQKQQEEEESSDGNGGNGGNEDDDLFDDGIPLGGVNAPKTGDMTMVWAVTAAVSGLGLVGLNLPGKKRKDDEEN